MLHGVLADRRSLFCIVRAMLNQTVVLQRKLLQFSDYDWLLYHERSP